MSNSLYHRGQRSVRPHMNAQVDTARTQYDSEVIDHQLGINKKLCTDIAKAGFVVVKVAIALALGYRCGQMLFA